MSTARPAAVCLGPRLAAAALIASALLLATSGVLQPTLTGGAAQKLAAVDAHPLRSGAAAVLFVLGQLPFMLAVAAIAGRLRDRLPRLAATGAALGVVGGLGHALFGGASLTYLVMARDEQHRSVLAELVGRIESSPVMLTSVAGLVGTVLGLLLLSIGLFRARVAPRWVGPVLWAFLLVEFVGSAVTGVASVVSAVLLVIAFTAIARTIVRLDPPDEGAAEPAPSRIDVRA